MASRAASVAGLQESGRVKMASRAASVAGLRNRNKIRNRAGSRQQPPKDDLPSSTPWFVVFIFVIPLQVAIFQLHFHDSSPFKTNPFNMWTFVFAVFIFCVAVAYYIKSGLTGSKLSKHICEKVGYISGFLTFAAFLSILVSPILVPVAYTLWMVISIMFIDVVRNRVLNTTQKLYQSSKNAASYVHNIWNRIIGINCNGATDIPVQISQMI